MLNYRAPILVSIFGMQYTSNPLELFKFTNGYCCHGFSIIWDHMDQYYCLYFLNLKFLFLKMNKNKMKEIGPHYSWKLLRGGGFKHRNKQRGIHPNSKNNEFEFYQNVTKVIHNPHANSQHQVFLFLKYKTIVGPLSNSLSF